MNENIPAAFDHEVVRRSELPGSPFDVPVDSPDYLGVYYHQENRKPATAGHIVVVPSEHKYTLQKFRGIFGIAGKVCRKL